MHAVGRVVLYLFYYNNYVVLYRGRRMQALSWTTEGFSAAKLKKAQIEKKSRDVKDIAVKVITQ